MLTLENALKINPILLHPQNFGEALVPGWKSVNADTCNKHVIGEKCPYQVIGSTVAHYSIKAKQENKPYYIFVWMHPRAGKSWMVSRICFAWILNLFPHYRALSFTHSVKLARENTVWVRDLLVENAPLLNVKIKPGHQEKTEFMTTANGKMIAAGVTTKILGQGFEIIGADDLFASEFEARSEAYQERLRLIWDSSIERRLEPGGLFFFPATRWDDNDLPAYIIEKLIKGGFEDRIIILNFPALSEGKDVDPLGRPEGAGLVPFRFPPEKLLEIKKTVPPHVWESQYMGRPQTARGAFFKDQWIREFSEFGPLFEWEDLVKGTKHRIAKSEVSFFQFWDTTLVEERKNKQDQKVDEADYTVCVTVGFWKDIEQDSEGKRLVRWYIFVYDVFRKQMQSADLMDALLLQKEKHPYVKKIFIEKASSGYTLLQTCLKRGIPAYGVDPEGKTKEERAFPAQNYYRLGWIFHLNNIEGRPALWRPDFDYELVAFPGWRFKDQVDAFSYACKCLQSDLDTKADRNKIPYYGVGLVGRQDVRVINSPPDEKAAIRYSQTRYATGARDEDPRFG